MQVLIDKCSFASVAELIKEKELSSELLPVDNSRPDYPASLELGKFRLRTLVVTSLEGGRIIRPQAGLSGPSRISAKTAKDLRCHRSGSGADYPAPEWSDYPDPGISGPRAAG